MKKQFWLAVVCTVFLSFAVTAQTGGTYDLSHSVIASGGGSNSTGGQFRVDGTVGQPAAGTFSTGGSISINGGFWTFDASVPTAATVSISGRVQTSDGRGLTNAIVSLSDSVGGVRTVITGRAGTYRIDDVESGRTYVLRVGSRRYTFTDPTRVISVTDDIANEDFIAEPPF